MPSKIDFIMPIEFAIKVSASSAELTEEELRKVVNEKITADLARDAGWLNGCAGCHTDDHKTFAYSYEAIAPIK